ncbi:LXG domain-containing protein [Bacillus sp. A116_S68]|nr:LXG domain-containing protein [Bacillus sp. A116_S68]
MKIFDAANFHHVIDQTLANCDTLKDQIFTLEKAIQSLVQIGPAFTGQGAEAIKRYFAETHLVLLQHWHSLLEEYKTVLQQTKVEAYNFEPHTNGFINDSFIEQETIPALENLSHKTARQVDGVNAVLDSISDIISIPKIDDSHFQHNVVRAKHYANDIIEKLHTFDQEQARKLRPIYTNIQHMLTYLNNLQGALDKGDFTVSSYVTGLSSNLIPKEAKALLKRSLFHRHLFVPYSFNQQSLHTTLAHYVNQAAGGFNGWLNPFANNVLLMVNLASGFMGFLGGLFPNKANKELSDDSTIEATHVSRDITGFEEGAIGSGELIHEWEGLGDHIEARGTPVDIDALRDAGIRVHTFETNAGHQLNYYVEGTNFVLLRDDPDLVYYTAGAKQSAINQHTARITKYGISTYLTLRFRSNFTSSWSKETGKSYIANSLFATIPIVGTPIPEKGEQEILVWLSKDDGETWHSRVYITVDKHGGVKPIDYEDKADNAFKKWLNKFDFYN